MKHKTFKDFVESKGLTMEKIEAEDFDANKRTELYAEYSQEMKTFIDDLEKSIDGKATKEQIEELKDAQKQFMELTNDTIVKMGLAMGKISNGGGSKPNAEKTLKDYIIENSEVLKKIKNKERADFSIEITNKAVQNASDINSGADYATLLPGTVRKPVRRVTLLDLFKRKPVSTEYIKYREENVVTRDAKVVIACATSEHTTKKSWVVRTVQLAKIRDIVDICIDMIEDYDFVEAEVKELVNESIKLKAEYEMLLGPSALATDMLSIDSISSEFDPANVLMPFSGAFKDANLEQLVDAMSAQIQHFGQQNKWIPNTVVMSLRDFVLYRNLKDADGNKIIRTWENGLSTIANLNVVTHPLVAQNELYVFDSNQGEILDRQMITIKESYENNDNIEHEIVTLVGVERIQFHVAQINRDAFMKCSDIVTAIEAITAS